MSDDKNGTRLLTAAGPSLVLTLLLPTACLYRSLAPWIWMWLIAFNLFLIAKCLTLLDSPASASFARRFAYGLLWPGMDASAFLGHRRGKEPNGWEWALAALKTGLGVILLLLATRCVHTNAPLLVGWLAMLGLVLLLHFGVFHLLSLFWRSRGVNAEPIMGAPLVSTSLSHFWSRDWNVAFCDLMKARCFKAVAKRRGPRTALLSVFAVSGLLHELVISLPARGGYGLPTAYFVTQGLGLLFERSRFGRLLGLGSGFKGWCFVLLVAGVPAFWLFNPVFIRNVILPMLHAIGGT